MRMEDVVLEECKAFSANKTLKSCEKLTVPKVETKKVYECKNVTKQHCTTLWKEVEGVKVWAGNNDCKNITWEECSSRPKNMTWMVPSMRCREEVHHHMDYQAVVRREQARLTDCQVKREQVCQPVTRSKCANIRYQVCQQVETLTFSTARDNVYPGDI